MSQSKLDSLPQELKRYLFSFFTAKELSLFRSNINKDFYAVLSKLKEEKLQEEYKKIVETKGWLTEMDCQRLNDFCFYAIDTYNKFKAFITLNPNYLMTCHGNNIVLICQVSDLLSMSGAEYSLHLMWKNETQLQLLYKPETSKYPLSYEEWFESCIIHIRCCALFHGQLSLYKSFFPDIIDSRLLETILCEMIINAYNSHPLIDSGVDEESEEGIIQIEMFGKLQSFISKLLSDNYDEYKAIILALIEKGIELDKGTEFNPPSVQLKRWRKEHDYFLPEKIIELLDLAPKSSKVKIFEVHLEMVM